MSKKTQNGLFGNGLLAVVLALAMLFCLLPSGTADSGRVPEASKAPSEGMNAPDSLVVEEISSSLTPEDLVANLVGTGVTISNVMYTGANLASGSFYGGDGIIGFESGIVLTSGSVHNVVGPNSSDSMSSINGVPGDPDLEARSGFTTNDASILEFDFVPDSDTVFFRYVFSSEEYNEFVNSTFNDVFAFFVNGVNCATVEGDPVSINTINYGNPLGSEPNSHPEYFVNNDTSDGGGALDTEMDGLTHVLTCWAPVTAGQTNTMKLAIADASDSGYDSAVFLEAASLTGDDVVELTGLEVTQAVQNWENDVVLIQDKPTYVRAHVRSLSGTTFNVKSRLIGRRAGVALPDSPLAPSNVGGNLDVSENPNRSALFDSFYFELPATWLSGTVEFELAPVTQPISCKDHAGIDDDCKVTVTFQETSQPEVRLVGIRWTDGTGTLHDPDAGDYAAVVQDIEAELPIHNLDWDNPTELDVAGNPPDLNDLLVTLEDQRILDGSDRLYYGLLVDHASGGLGLGQRPGWVSAGYYRLHDPTTATHEIGHNLGRRHTDCSGDEANTDPNYPYDYGQISQQDTGDSAYYGFHIGTKQVFPPYTGDLMGYCRPRWVSDYHYEAMRTEIVDRWGGTQVQSTLLTAGEPAILVSGLVNSTVGSAQFRSLLTLDSPTDVTAPEPGPYSVRFIDAYGHVVDEYPFDASIPEGGDEATGLFSLLLPWHADARQIEVSGGTTVLLTRTASNAVPIVQTQSPNAGDVWTGDTATIVWNGSDPDGDDVKYTVLYSTDGGVTWLTLVTGLQEMSYEVDLNTLPGSDQAVIRVMANDGFHTTPVQTDGTFLVQDHAPVPLIKSPASGSLFVEDQSIILRGSAHDAEDGKLDGAHLSWWSSVDGLLGFGESIAVNTATLTEGTHTLTLSAQDSDAQVGSMTTAIEVYSQRPTLPKNLAVAPGLATLSVAQAASPPSKLDIAIRNEGDGTISWSSSTSESWLSLSQSEGFTPADVILEVDPTGLSTGIYNGIVTITGADALNGPQDIEIELRVQGSQSTKAYLPIVIKLLTQSCGLTEQTVTGDSLPTANQDVYSFAGTAGTTVSVYVDTVSSASAFDIEVCLSTSPSSDDCFAFGDDQMSCTYPPPQYACPSFGTDLPSDADGVYFLLIESGSGSNNYAGAVGEYRANITASPGICVLTLVANNLPGDFR